MLRYLVCCLMLVGITDAFAQKFKPKYLRENDKSFLQLTSRATDDGWIEFRTDVEAIEAASFSTRFAKNLGLKDGYHLRSVKDKTDPKETRHQHYQLYWKNALVEGGHLSLHSRKGRLVAAHTRIIENLDIATDKLIAEGQALKTALANRKLTVDGLDDSQKRPKSILVLTRMDGDYVKESYRLAYSFDLYSKNFQDANRVYVDAISGDVLKHYSLTSKCFDPQHTAQTGKSIHSLLMHPLLNRQISSLYWPLRSIRSIPVVIQLRLLR